MKLLGEGLGVREEAYNVYRTNNGGVDFLGLVPYHEVPRILKNVDLVIHPSLEESFGMAVAEALASRTPVIGGKTSGAVPWVLNGGKAGLLVDVRDPKKIAQSAVRLLRDRKLWNRLSDDGYAHAVRSFSLPEVSNAYLRVYEKVRDAI